MQVGVAPDLPPCVGTGMGRARGPGMGSWFMGGTCMSVSQRLEGPGWDWTGMSVCSETGKSSVSRAKASFNGWGGGSVCYRRLILCD